MTHPLIAELLAAVADLPIVDEPVGMEPAPVFSIDEAGVVEHVAGYPPITCVALRALAGWTPPVIDWDGRVLLMPGGLRYLPVGITPDRRLVVLRRADVEQAT